MIAAVCAWHEHHERAAGEIDRRLSRKEPMIAAAPALVETYAVLTRLPPPHRLSPGDALALLDGSFMQVATVVALDAKSYGALLRSAPGAGVAGGRIYDEVIAACAVKAKVAALLTFNEGDFSSLKKKEIDIIVPSAR